MELMRFLVFTLFALSTALVRKPSLWEERDKAITAGYEEPNNKVLQIMKYQYPTFHHIVIFCRLLYHKTHSNDI